MSRRFLNHAARIACQSCGQALRFPAGSTSSWRIGGDAALLRSHVEKAVLTGCPQVGKGERPCTGVASILRGPVHDVQIDHDLPIDSDVLVLTDGTPPQLCNLLHQEDESAWSVGSCSSAVRPPAVPETRGASSKQGNAARAAAVGSGELVLTLRADHGEATGERDRLPALLVGVWIRVVQDERVFGRLLSSTVGSEAWNSRDLKSRPH